MPNQQNRQETSDRAAFQHRRPTRQQNRQEPSETAAYQHRSRSRQHQNATRAPQNKPRQPKSSRHSLKVWDMLQNEQNAEQQNEQNEQNAEQQNEQNAEQQNEQNAERCLPHSLGTPLLLPRNQNSEWPPCQLQNIF